MNNPEKPFSNRRFFNFPEVEPGEIEVQDVNEIPLHVCTNGCGCDFVYPMQWEEISFDEKTDKATWEMTLRCPECENIREGKFTDKQVGVLDQRLNEDTESLLLAIKNLSRSNMEEDVERISYALQHNAIEPMDF